jgi:hypothetical protein
VYCTVYNNVNVNNSVNNSNFVSHGIDETQTQKVVEEEETKVATVIIINNNKVEVEMNPIINSSFA